MELEALHVAESVLVLRGGKVLTRPGGGVPTKSEIDDFILIIVSDRYGDMIVVTSSTGDPPEGWTWMDPIVLQRQLDDDESDCVGEALLCAA